MKRRGTQPFHPLFSFSAFLSFILTPCIAASLQSSINFHATSIGNVSPLNDEINYKSNPLHGLSLKNMLIELKDHYDFDILFAYLNINCFKTNPSIESSVKFLKKTDWAREKVEAFYLYQYKNLPKASDEQFALAPRDRVIPDGQTPGEPAKLTLEDAERLREKRAEKASRFIHRSGHQKDRKSNEQTSSRKETKAIPESGDDPWARFRKK